MINGRVLDSRPRGCRCQPHRHHCIVSLSKNINPSLVLVQPWKTRPFITERLLMGRKESNQTKIIVIELLFEDDLQIYLHGYQSQKKYFYTMFSSNKDKPYLPLYVHCAHTLPFFQNQCRPGFSYTYFHVRIQRG